ncbi:hypothetical protein [Yersinia ruckeri]|uniref:hypothetical protein n=1 Tax=Yersinia ruckeri TaxID=29486 RepID=UPI0022390C4B|nr:hypothetical protein [Yersinia ruckeri]MCW6598716.1 hypothetical protein [Yersinia ruckeri]
MRGSYSSRIAGSTKGARNTVHGKRVSNPNIITADSLGNFGGLGGMGGSGNYVTNQHAESGIDMMNIYSTHRYLPKNPLHQNAIFRQIYRYDSTAGAVIELYSNMPWSDFQLGNISDTSIRNLYEDAFSNLDLVTKLPHLTRDYLILGKMCGFMSFDESRGVWSDLIQQNPDYIRAFPIPFSNQDPLIFLTPPREMATLAQKIINLNIKIDDPDSKKLLEFAAKMQPTQLDNASTFYMPRKSFVDDYNGTSIYTRILSLVLLEAALLNANLLNAFRRAGPIRVISPNEDQSEMMAPEQLDTIALMFMEADMDPVGSTIVLDKALNIDNINSANEGQWRVFDEWGTLQAAKMNALGFAETLISGDSSYQTNDSQISIFLERLLALRNDVTNHVILNHICMGMAKANDFVKRSKAELDHRIRINHKDRDNSQYIIPTIQWNKPLTPVGNQDYINLLEKAQEQGVPVSIRTWASACGIDYQSEVENLMQDAQDRALTNRFKDSNGMITEDNRPHGAPDPTEFVDMVTADNFKLLDKGQIKNYMLLYRGTTDTMRKKMIPQQFILFQLYLACINVPYENLTTDEFAIMDKLLEDNYNLDGKLKEFITPIVEQMKAKTPRSDEDLSESQVQLTKNASQQVDSENEISKETNPDGSAKTSAPKDDSTNMTNKGKVSKEIIEKSLELALSDILRQTEVKNIGGNPVVNTNKVKLDDTSKSMTERLIKLRTDIMKMNPEDVAKHQMEQTQDEDRQINEHLKDTLEFINTLELSDDCAKNAQIILTQLKLRNKQVELNEEGSK